MASQMIKMMKRNSNEEVELIDFKQGNLEFADNTYEQSQDLSWLDIKQEKTLTFVPGFVPWKKMSKAVLAIKKRKENQTEFEKRLINQRGSSIGFLQNHQMGKAIKKDWDIDVAYVRNLFAYLLVWTNPIRIQAKIREHANQLLVNWSYFMWETMMSKALKDFIKRENVWRKIEWNVKENTALNIVHDFLKNRHLDEEIQ